jgi:serine/threonine protein kinase
MVGREVGPYQILQKIAQGGMSSVYKGLHVGLEQEVAIKVLSPESFEDPCLRDRFISEAKIQARLSHPNVIKTMNYLEYEGTVFLVMEYVNGESLDALLKKVGSLPIERAGIIFMSVLEAIEFMHSKGIIHRDIKPANIMLSYDRYVKVMDFGIAKVMGEKGKTAAGIRIGTLWYMSPEQIRGEEATALTDIYALGITLYQMVTGRVPFTADLEFDIMRGHLEQVPVPPWKINKDVPRELGLIILKAMAKNPKERYQSVREFLEALRSVMKTLALSETKVIQMPEEGLGGGSWSGPLCRLSHARRRMSIALFIFAIAVLAVLAVLMVLRHGEKPVPSAADIPLEKRVGQETLKNEKPVETLANAEAVDKTSEERDNAPKKAPEKPKKVKKAGTVKNGFRSHKGEVDSKNSPPPQQSPPSSQPEAKTDWSIRK